MELDLEIIKEVRLFYPEIKDRDAILYNAVFYHSVFDFIPYEEYQSEKPITNVFQYSLQDMMKQSTAFTLYKRFDKLRNICYIKTSYEIRRFKIRTNHKNQYK